MTRTSRGGEIVASERKGGAEIVRLKGRLDQELVGLLEEGTRGTLLVLDLAEVAYANSSGLAGLAHLSTRRDLRLARVPAVVREVLGLAGLDRILAIYDDEAAAIVAPPRTGEAS